MKKLILLFCVVASFAACKKNVDLTKQSPADTYSGIKNVKEFDKLIEEIIEPINNKNERIEMNTSKLRLSTEAIQELRNSIVFDKNGVFHGFKKMTITNKELSRNEREQLLSLIANTQVIVLDKNSRIVSNPNINNWTKPYTLTCHDDWRWNWGQYGTDCCLPNYDATCCTYGPTIVCN